MGFMKKGKPRYKTENVSGHYRPSVVKRGNSYIFKKDLGKKNPPKLTPAMLRAFRIREYNRRDFRKSGQEHQDYVFSKRSTYRKL